MIVKNKENIYEKLTPDVLNQEIVRLRAGVLNQEIVRLREVYM